MLANIVWMCVGARLKVVYVNRWTLACACCGVIVEGNRLRGLLPPLPLLSGNIMMKSSENGPPSFSTRQENHGVVVKVMTSLYLLSRLHQARSMELIAQRVT